MGKRNLVALVAVVWGVLLGGAGTALAAVVHPFLSSFGSFTNVQAVAVDSAGYVYVFDNATGSVSKFNATGEPAVFLAHANPSEDTNTIEGVGANTPYVAVSELAVSSAGATKGDLYVANGTAVGVYNSETGAKLGELNGEVAGLGLGAPWGNACGVAVDAQGHVYVGLESGSVNRYDPSGPVVENGNYSGSLWHVGYETCNLAVDSQENVFVVDWEHGPVTRYTAAEFNTLETPPVLPVVVDTSGSSLAVDPKTDDVYVDEQSRFVQYGPHGEPFKARLGSSGSFGPGALSRSFGIAVNSASNEVYASDGQGHISVFGAGVEVEPPAVAIGTPTGVTGTVATLHGTVDPQGSQPSNDTSWHFEYSTNGGKTWASTPGGTVAGSTSAVPVQEQLTSLLPGSEVEVRLVAANGAGSVTSGMEAFTTLPAPPHGGQGCANETLREEQQSLFLPDCRAYELVSPQEKGGFDIAATTERTRAAQSVSAGEPMAVQFTSMGAFGDAVGTAGTAEEYMALRDGSPGTQGWSTHAITPPQGQLAIDQEPFGGVYMDFSEDLSMGVFRSWTPVTEAPNVQNLPDLYTRSDLRTSGHGSYQLDSDCLAPPLGPCTSPLPATRGSATAELPWYAGASADLGRIVFESTYNLTSDAPPQPAACTPSQPSSCVQRLYESDHGTVRLVGVLPNGEAAASSRAGRGAEYYATPHIVSADGTRVLFTEPLYTGGGSNGFIEVGVGKLFMRIDGERTVQINASELATPATPEPATYWDASADDSRVFFSTTEPLTENAQSSVGVPHLYMYDLNAPAGHRLTLIDQNDTGRYGVEGVMGASEDGHYVYFLASHQLVPGAPAIDENTENTPGVFMWHDGTLSFVGQINDFNDSANATLSEWASSEVRVTPDGRHLLFPSLSGAGLMGYDQSGCRGGCSELYLYSAASEGVPARLQCVSCNPSGVPATTGAFDNIIRGEVNSTGIEAPAPRGDRALSDNGRYVFFDTEEALVPQDINSVADAYEFDSLTGEVHLLSTGRGDMPSWVMDASADGSDVFIATRDRLVGWDRDADQDLYDVRIGGGFREPYSQPACIGEACQGSAGSAPEFAAPGSASLSGSGNVAPVSKGATSKHKAKPKAKRRRRGKARSRRRRGANIQKRPRKASHGRERKHTATHGEDQ